MASPSLPSPEEFVLQAIGKLQGQNSKYPVGIHVVYSGFNQAFKRAYPKLNPITVVDKMAEAGTIEKRLCRGGAVIYLPGTAPARKDRSDDVLGKILG